MSAAFMCDVLKNKYWQKVPICKNIYNEIKKYIQRLIMKFSYYKIK